jgi:hypothetical protein
VWVIAGPAWRTGRAAVAGGIAFPRPIQMLITNPPRVIAKGTEYVSVGLQLLDLGHDFQALNFVLVYLLLLLS